MILEVVTVDSPHYCCAGPTRTASQARASRRAPTSSKRAVNAPSISTVTSRGRARRRPTQAGRQKRVLMPTAPSSPRSRCRAHPWLNQENGADIHPCGPWRSHMHRTRRHGPGRVPGSSRRRAARRRYHLRATPARSPCLSRQSARRPSLRGLRSNASTSASAAPIPSKNRHPTAQPPTPCSHDP